jgi:hypothetical protein
MWALAACLALGALSLLLPSAPTYDPYAWLIWGRGLAHLHLVTTGSGTAWKPFPALVAALFSPLGSGAEDAWLALARAGTLFAIYMTYRLAARIAGRAAGVAAALTLVLVHEFVRRNAVGNAEGLMTAFGLVAIQLHLDGRRGPAFAAVVAACLIRPETWPFALAYGAWLWVRHDGPRRWVMLALAALVPLLWFGGDWLGSGNPFGASDHALGVVPTAPRLGAHPGLGVLGEAAAMVPRAAEAALAIAIAWSAAVLLAGRRRAVGERERRAAVLTLALAAGAVAWTLVVAVMAERGYAGLPRFLFMGLALAAVVAGVGVARAAELAAIPLGRAATRPVRAAAAMAALACLAVLSAPDARLLRADAQAVKTVASRDDSLKAAVRRLGGRDAVLRCGRPYTGWFATTALAWDLGLDVGVVHDRPHGRHPVVFVLDQGLPGLGGHVPTRHVHVTEDVGNWDVVDRCDRKS